MKYMHISHLGYHKTCKYWVILCRNCEDCFILLEIPSNKLAVMKCAYLLIFFFKSVSKPNAIRKNVINVCDTNIDFT